MKKMHIQELSIKNFRGIRDVRFTFSDDHPIVLIGKNGSGKSSILDCIAVLLSQFAARLRNPKAAGRFFVERDIRADTSELSSEITVQIEGKSVSWFMLRARNGTRRIAASSLKDLRIPVDVIQQRLEEDKNANIPLAVYYPTNRSVIDIPLRIRNRHSFNQLDAYEMALSGGGIAFRHFFEWFREREDIENETRLDESSFRDVQLEAVRQAIHGVRPEYTQLRVRHSPLRMLVNKSGQELAINWLSDGEKCLLALVGDLARRLAIANPNSENALHGEGIVLIDEIELHLHPEWQREIVLSLRKTFPNCQLIITTHSPQVISEILPEDVYVLDGEPYSHPESSYGRDSNRILEDIMGVSERPVRIKEGLQSLFRLINAGQLEEAQRLQKSIADEIGADEPAFSKADVLIGRRKAIGK